MRRRQKNSIPPDSTTGATPSSAGRPPTDSGEGGQWRRRATLSRLLRVAVFLVPVLAGLAASILFSRLIPRPNGLTPVILWYVALGAGILLVTLAFERGARRLLPLAALLNLSLIFPAQAPNRFAVAPRVGQR